MKKLVIFDFDGTLVDTITDVGICFNQALAMCDFPQHPLERFADFAGGNLETVVSKMLPKNKVTEDNITAVKNIYRQLYLESKKINTRPYNGVTELLKELKRIGYKIAINSNKGQLLLDDMIGKLFDANLFDDVVGYLETRPSKPDPYGVYLICDHCGCKREETVYVGDGESDVETAANAGIHCIYVEWGQGNKSDWNTRYEAKVVNTMLELEKALIGEEK